MTDDLTWRDMATLDILCSGTPVKLAAEEQGLSYRTVQSRLNRLFTIYGVNTQAAVVAAAFRRGDLEVSEDADISVKNRRLRSTNQGLRRKNGELETQLAEAHAVIAEREAEIARLKQLNRELGSGSKVSWLDSPQGKL